MTPVRYRTVRYHARPRPLITDSELATLVVGLMAGALIVTAISKPQRMGCIFTCCDKIIDAIIQRKI